MLSNDVGAGPLMFALSIAVSCLSRASWAVALLIEVRKANNAFRRPFSGLLRGTVPAGVMLCFELSRSLVNLVAALIVFGLVQHSPSTHNMILCYAVSRELEFRWVLSTN